MSSVDGRLIDGRWTAPYEAEYGDLLKVYASIGRELNTDGTASGVVVEFQDVRSKPPHWGW